MEQAEPASESTALEGTPAVDQPSAPEEASVPSEPTSTDEMEATTLPNVEDHTLEQPVDAVPTPMSTSSISNTGSALFGDAALGIASPDSRNPEPLARSLTSPSPSEASESDSDSDLELEEYVDVETMSTSEDEGTELEEVERDGDLELMREWDLDF
ncbi:hypothetical protein OPQ81_000972 [Rhizoctonia solani]|nr:hypothetical protein OPQ81_000972 [Rhizoctonia solani]